MSNAISNCNPGVTNMPKPEQIPHSDGPLGHYSEGWCMMKRHGVPVVILCCPGCGVTGELDHEVSLEGNVSPSVECPEDGCSFHKTVQLMGWCP